MRCLLVALVAALTAPCAHAAGWEGLSADGRIVVHVLKKGLFSAFAHDHHFEVTEWRASAEIPEGSLAATSVDIVLSASSLRDRQERLSEADRRKVDAQAAGPQVLDAENHPRIEFRSRRLELEEGSDREHVRGTLHGTLAVRGRTVPADVRVDAERGPNEWRVRGSARVKQRDLGIEPFKGFGGTVGVKDELEIELRLTLHPRRRG